MRDKNCKCHKCGNENLQLHTEATTKSTVGKIIKWLKICNENVLLWFNYRANAGKMQKEMPTYLEKQWVCPECGEKHADYEEVAAKYKLLGKVDIGVTFFWGFSIVVAILIWAIEFQMVGIVYLLLIEVIIFLLAMFVRYGLRKSMGQLQQDLIKLEG